MQFYWAGTRPEIEFGGVIQSDLHINMLHGVDDLTDNRMFRDWALEPVHLSAGCFSNNHTVINFLTGLRVLKDIWQIVHTIGMHAWHLPTRRQAQFIDGCDLFRCTSSDVQVPAIFIFSRASQVRHEMTQPENVN